MAKSNWDKDHDAFLAWLETTFPGPAGKSRRYSFQRYIRTMHSEIAHSTEEMNERTADFEERCRKYDADHHAAGWYISTMNKWESFHRERTGLDEPGTLKRLTEERDAARAGAKTRKKRTHSETTSKPRKRVGKYLLGDTAQLDLFNPPAGTDYGRWHVCTGSKPPAVADTQRAAFFFTAPKPEDCKLYFKSYIFTFPLWRDALDRWER